MAYVKHFYIIYDIYNINTIPGGNIMEYYEVIKNLRVDHDKSQIEIAVLLNTTQAYYCKYELSKHPLPIQHLITLCQYYNVSADYILGLPRGLPYGFSKTK